MLVVYFACYCYFSYNVYFSNFAYFCSLLLNMFTVVYFAYCATHPIVVTSVFCFLLFKASFISAHVVYYCLFCFMCVQSYIFILLDV